MTTLDLDVFTCPLHDISLIEASAGTGKTWNICGLYLRLLLEKELAVERILVVTFTNAATAELRERIRSRIVETWNWLQAGKPAASDPFVPRLVAAVAHNAGVTESDMLRRLDVARHGFDEAAIFTIHGFCQRALADTPFAAGLPFALELSTDDDSLLQSAIRDFWRRHISARPLAPLLIQSLMANGDCPESWAPLLKRHLAKPLSRCLWPEPALSDLPPEVDSAGLSTAYQEAQSAWNAGKGALPSLLDGLPALNAQSYKPDTVTAAARHWQAYLDANQPLAPADVEEGKMKLFDAEHIAKKLKKNQTAPVHGFFAAAGRVLTARQQLLDTLDLARLWLIRRMLEEAGKTLRAEKRRQRLLSFDDMLANVHHALYCGDYPWLAGALKQRFPVALIDEFQDTDPLQFAIFDTIYRPPEQAAGPLFLVGDPKQAIYSFRNADLHTYLAARKTAKFQHTLGHNQRSVAPLIAALNALFGANPSAFVLEGLNYEAVEVGDKPRKPLRDDSGGDVHALQVWRLEDESGQPPTRKDAKTAAVNATAAEISRLIRAGRAGQITVGDQPLFPGQIAVLVKSHAQGRSVRLALARLGIASVELSQESVFDSSDAQDMQRLLAGILEPGRPALLHAALCTEVMGLNALDLAALRQNEADLSALMLRFDAYRQLWLNRGFGLMFRRWLTGEKVIQRLLARPDGERRMTNLLHLAELLQQAETEQRSPEALLRWLGEARQGAGAAGAISDAAQVRLESDRNLVQIVTIHKSKGLEYDFVFCPFLWDGFQKNDSGGEGLEYHDGSQPVIDFRPEAREDDDIKAGRRAEKDAELLRLFYVALTRAVQRCYLIAGSYQTLAFGRPSFTESNRSLLNWLAAGQGLSHAQWREHKLTPEELLDAWQNLAQATPSLAWLPLPLQPGQPVHAGDDTADDLRCPAPPPTQHTAWRIGSFSSLNHGEAQTSGQETASETAANELAASDHDGRADSAQAEAQRPAHRGSLPDELPRHDILRFPRGAAAGDCLHAVLENIDFSNHATWPEAIRHALSAHPQHLPGQTPGDATADLGAMLTNMLNDLLATPLPAGLQLAQLQPADKKVELEFNLPTPSLSAQALNRWLAERGFELPPLQFADLHGYLKGYIDLVFRYQGRYYLLDWKSNHLGYRPEHYGQAAMAQEMADHGYTLQYLLYSVALHRYLALRLPDYDYGQHFGGVLYLFLRGVRPDWQNDGRQSGVFFTRPDHAVVQDLNQLLAGGK